MSRQYALRIITVAFVVFVGGFFVFGKSDYSLLNSSGGDLVIIVRQAKLNPPPLPIRGVYVTSWVAGSSQRMNEIIKLVDETELNAVVIDVKDYSGKLAFKTKIPLADSSGAHREIRIRDVDGLIKRLHEKNIYVIGRVQVFQDPTLAEARPDLAVQDKTEGIWRDYKGLAWLDPAAKEVWDYTVAIAQEMDKHGFDEVNLDYIRFPSDGPLSRMRFLHWDGTVPRPEIIRSFYSYFREKTKEDNIRISADVFGLTALRALDSRYDGNIGQRMADALPNFDFISPMVYPSHYATGTIGIADPNENPYPIVNASLLAT